MVEGEWRYPTFGVNAVQKGVLSNNKGNQPKDKNIKNQRGCRGIPEELSKISLTGTKDSYGHSQGTLCDGNKMIF
jgi:hypothetical protein